MKIDGNVFPKQLIAYHTDLHFMLLKFDICPESNANALNMYKFILFF